MMTQWTLRSLLALGALLLTFQMVHAEEVKPLSGSQIKTMLSGNSVVDPGFGCVYFDPAGDTNIVTLNGVERQGRWGVLGDLYYSNAACGVDGCNLKGSYPNFVFERTSGGYSQPVLLLQGNHCDKDGTVS